MAKSNYEARPENIAFDWIKERGGDCAVATTKAGGRTFLAKGETGPFTNGTVKRLVEAGRAEYYQDRRRLRLLP